MRRRSAWPRQANGIVKIVAERELPIHICQLMQQARAGYTGSEAEKKFKNLGEQPAKLAAFFRERLEFYLREARGFAYDVVNAVLVAGADDVVDTVLRAEAVTAVRNTENFEAISVSFKRMKNILRQAREAKHTPASEFAPTMAREKEEITLSGQMPHIAGTADRLRMEGK